MVTDLSTNMSLHSGIKPLELSLCPAVHKPTSQIVPRTRPLPRLPSTNRPHTKRRRVSDTDFTQGRENGGLSVALARVLRRLLVEPRGVLEPKPIINSRIQSVLGQRRIGELTKYGSGRGSSLSCSPVKPTTVKDMHITPAISLRKKSIRAVSTLPKHPSTSLTVETTPTSTDLSINSQRVNLRSNRMATTRSRARPATTLLHRPSAPSRSISVPRAELLTRNTQTEFQDENQPVLLNILSD